MLQNVGFIVVGVGMLITFIFYLSTKEPENERRMSRLHSFSDSQEIVRMTWTQWFKNIQFYQVLRVFIIFIFDH